MRHPKPVRVETAPTKGEDVYLFLEFTINTKTNPLNPPTPLVFSLLSEGFRGTLINVSLFLVFTINTLSESSSDCAQQLIQLPNPHQLGAHH